jgi:hypothetical protein
MIEPLDATVCKANNSGKTSSSSPSSGEHRTASLTRPNGGELATDF